MNVMSCSADKVLVGKVGFCTLGEVVAEARVVLKLHAQCSVAFYISHLKATIMRVAVLGFFKNSQFIS
jgi:hypothetical protein